MRSIASTHSDAAANASRRRPIGTVPACPAMPVSSIWKRLPPLMAVTTPVARPSASSTGPCSMCNSAYASTSSGRRATADDLRGIEAGLAQRVAHRHAARVDVVEHRVIERAGYCATSEQRRAEAHAFLVAEAQHLDREGKARPAGIERVHAFDGGDHAEHAVVLSGIANGIEMRTQHQARLSGSRALVAAGDSCRWRRRARPCRPRASSPARVRWSASARRKGIRGSVRPGVPTGGRAHRSDPRCAAAAMRKVARNRRTCRLGIRARDASVAEILTRAMRAAALENANPRFTSPAADAKMNHGSNRVAGLRNGPGGDWLPERAAGGSGTGDHAGIRSRQRDRLPSSPPRPTQSSARCGNGSALTWAARRPS